MNKNLVSSLIEESQEQDYYINESEGKLNIDINYFREKSSMTIPYNKVIIKYNGNFNISCQHNHKWLTIDDDNNQIIVYREHRNLSIDDILYATRPIAVTYAKSNYMVELDKQEFKIYSFEKDTFILSY
jgi:hypothetical protein